MSSPKIVVITGANTGIGYETVKALVQSDEAYRIFVGSRSIEKGETAIETLRKEFPESPSTMEVLQVDVSTDESIQQASETVKAKTEYVDVLINNAGAAFDILHARGQIGLRDCFNQAYNINVSGAHLMTYVFMPLLLKSSDPRLLFIAGLSQMSVASQHYFPTPPQPAGWPKDIDFETIGYRCSKTALNMLMIDYTHKLKADGVKVWGVLPGFLATNLGGLGPEYSKSQGAGPDPGVGGKFIASVVEGARDEDVGKIVGRDGIVPF
ncbi:NAD(P)-binding protein [Aspergillus floccosus]